MSEEEPASAASTLFDLRTVIAMLFIVYGVVLTIMGITSNSKEDQAKDGGININLWTGLVMIVVAGSFFAWAYLRPLHPVAGVVEPGTSRTGGH